MNKHHPSSSVSFSCKGFLFHQNGTASGFIKIYELNHHWKYKTLVGEQGQMGKGGSGQTEREKKGIVLVDEENETKYVGERKHNRPKKKRSFG